MNSQHHPSLRCRCGGCLTLNTMSDPKNYTTGNVQYTRKDRRTHTKQHSKDEHVCLEGHRHLWRAGPIGSQSWGAKRSCATLWMCVTWWAAITIPKDENLKEKRVILAHSFRGFSPQLGEMSRCELQKGCFRSGWWLHHEDSNLKRNKGTNLKVMVFKELH